MLAPLVRTAIGSMAGIARMAGGGQDRALGTGTLHRSITVITPLCPGTLDTLGQRPDPSGTIATAQEVIIRMCARVPLAGGRWRPIRQVKAPTRHRPSPRPRRQAEDDACPI